ncbi:MAG: NfeD family protein [Deltaproteobacteria bacterium]|jgi:membrane protein implicated in regulation of membrane protease activity|nr:NfeD family protein [Deltaproteobacteria bacterium]
MELLGSYKLFWFLLGLLFLGLEVLTPGVFLLFFGIGSWFVLLLLLPLPNLPMVFQWAIFIIVSVVCLVALRGQLKRLFNRKEGGRGDSLKDPLVANGYIGREIDVVSVITPEKPGTAEFNGTNWQAKSSATIPQGARARIVEVRDLTLWVEPIKNPEN